MSEWPGLDGQAGHFSRPRLLIHVVKPLGGSAVPEVIVYCVEGRTPEQKKGLMKDITDAMVKNFNVKSEVVTVQIVESPKDSKARGGVPFSEM